MTNFLIISGLGLFLLAAWHRREWGVYLIILLLPTYQVRFSFSFVPLTFLEGMILLLALTEAVHLSRIRGWGAAWQSITRQKILAIFVGLSLLAALLSVFTGPSLAKGAGIFKAYFFEAILFFVLTLLIIDSPQKLLRLSKSFALLVAYLSAFGVYQFFTLANLPPSWWAVDVASRRITSLLNHPNALALLLGPPLAFLVFAPKTRWSWAVIGLGTVALYLSFSRAAWLAVLLAVLLVGLLTEHRKKIVLAGAAIALLVVTIPYSRQKLVELSNGADPSRENRLVLWRAASDMLKQSPILGAGLTGFREQYKNYPLGPDRVVQNYPHSFFLNFWLETGLLGLVAIASLLILYAKKVRALMGTAEYRWLAFGLTAAMLTVLLHGAVDVPYFKNDLSVLFWLFLALPQLRFLPD